MSELSHLDVELNRSRGVAVLVDLIARIQGELSIAEQPGDRIPLSNNAGPFGDKVAGRPSLCMITSNVFGTITAGNLGYARADLENTIARGDDHCRVTVYLNPTDQPQGREYFPS